MDRGDWVAVFGIVAVSAQATPVCSHLERYSENMQRALITGINGQDGSYLAELLLAKGYEVHGTVRPCALTGAGQRLWRLQPWLHRLHLHAVDLRNYTAVTRLMAVVKPLECYHLAARSFVSYDFEAEAGTLDFNLTGTHHLLAALRSTAPACRFYFSGSSEMFGAVQATPQTEQTVFNPRSAYGISKVAGFHLTRNYRERHGLFAVAGILYNHESPRRGNEFVTRKITRQVARIRAGLTDELHLGNLDARRDWGHARDYVDAMWRMLQQPHPEDFVIATGRSHSVREFVAYAFRHAGLEPERHVVVDPRYYRPTERTELRGDAAKARRQLGWRPTVSLQALVGEMVDADIRSLAATSNAAAPVALAD